MTVKKRCLWRKIHCVFHVKHEKLKKFQLLVQPHSGLRVRYQQDFVLLNTELLLQIDIVFIRACVFVCFCMCICARACVCARVCVCFVCWGLRPSQQRGHVEPVS